jgi:hypothetical protein
MKLHVIVAAIAMVFGTAAYADMTSVTTTSVKTTSHHAKGMHHHSGMHHHRGMHHRHHSHHQMKMHRGKAMVKKVVMHEEMSPPGSVTMMK